MAEMDAARTALYEHLCDALGEANASNLVTDLVLAAFESDEKLRARLARQPVTRTEPVRLPPPAPGAIPGIYLKSIAVRGFRGIGPLATLPLQPGPGLTLVLGRNGSGKSSFAEAAELALTNRTERAERGRVWKDGWRNLHSSNGVNAPRVEVELTVEGTDRPRKIVRAWEANATDLAAATTVVQIQGEQSPTAYADLGWAAPLTDYRPFLTYSELSGLITNAGSQIYDTLAPILGLDDLAQTDQRLQKAHSDLDSRAKAVRARRAALLTDLEALTDPRAAVVRKAIKSATLKSWDLAAVESVLGPAGGGGATGADLLADELETLTALVALPLPDLADVTGCSSGLRAAADRVTTLAGSHASQAKRLADLLRAGLDHHKETSEQTCPLCGAPGRLNDSWRTLAAGQLAEFEQRAAQAVAADQQLAQERARALALVSDPPPLLAAYADAAAARPAPVAGSTPGDSDLRALAAEVLGAWQTWAGLRAVTTPVRLADELDAAYTDLAVAVETLRAAANAKLTAIETAWSPVAHALTAWLAEAREAQSAQESVAALAEGRKLLQATTQRLRNERIAPFADHIRAIWADLRQESNVDLGAVELVGTGTRRSIRLEATVDGVEGDALGVLSQGELHAVGLSLFLPRATLPESPFRFIVIDDPVQAMDPAKVDGLAKVLLDAARERQVVVFTHDDRLADAVRRFDTEHRARSYAVVRREQSVVEVKPVSGPAWQLLEDAEALLDTDNLPHAVKAGVVPALCKSAVDAACADVYRRRQLEKGAKHHEVEAALAGARTVYHKAALAFFDDMTRTDAVLSGANNRWGRDHGDTIRTINGMGHEPYGGNCRVLLKSTVELVRAIGTL